jgi:hypothetical protein
MTPVQAREIANVWGDQASLRRSSFYVEPAVTETAPTRTRSHVGVGGGNTVGRRDVMKHY